MGAWIETVMDQPYISEYLVAPYVGAWIETDKVDENGNKIPSHPTWVRGLKQKWQANDIEYSVAPYVGAWIET